MTLQIGNCTDNQNVITIYEKRVLRCRWFGSCQSSHIKHEKVLHQSYCSHFKMIHESWLKSQTLECDLILGEWKIINSFEPVSCTFPQLRLCWLRDPRGPRQPPPCSSSPPSHRPGSPPACSSRPGGGESWTRGAGGAPASRGSTPSSSPPQSLAGCSPL